MRVALCFSGQIRSGVDCSNNILKFIDTLDNFDVFIHTWDIETNKWITPGDDMKRAANMDDINEFIDIFKPKKVIISNYDEYQCPYYDSNDPVFIPLMHIPMFQSIYESNELKKAYEKEHRFKYDYVVRIRPDCVYFSPHKLSNEIGYAHNRDKQFNPIREELYTCDHWNKLPNAVEDILWIASSDVMDKVCNFGQWKVLHTEYIYKDWQVQLVDYLHMLNIDVRSMQYNNLVIDHRCIAGDDYLTKMGIIL